MIEKILKKIKFFLSSKKIKRHSLVGQSNLWKLKREFQIKFLKNQGLESSNLFLDIGCGTLRGGIPIIKFLEPGNYYGIDVREIALNEAKKEVVDEKLERKKPNLILFEDFKDLNIESKFDKMIAFSVLIHMDDDVLDNCFKFVAKHLKREGKLYANVNIGDGLIGNWQGFPVVAKNLEFYEKLASQYELELRDLGTLRDFQHHSGSKDQDDQKMLEFRFI